MRANQMPRMVRFNEIDYPQSIEHVDPEDLVASFGPGV